MQNTEAKRKCLAEHCESGKIYGHGYCEKHYTQIRTHGKVLPRTSQDPNEIIIEGEIARVMLYRGRGIEEIVGEFIIDSDDVDKIKDFKWSKTNGYIYHRRSSTYIHRLITDCPDGYVVDHINGDKEDNRKSNLRIVTQQGNARNITAFKPKNYYYNKINNTWCVNLSINNKTVYFGAYDTEEEAIEVAKKVREEYYTIDEYEKDVD